MSSTVLIRNDQDVCH